MNRLISFAIATIFPLLSFAIKEENWHPGDSSNSIILFNKQYIKSYLLDTKDIVISPTKWHSKQWLTFSGVAATTTFLVWKGDRKVHDFAQSNRSVAGDNISRHGIEPWGDGPYSMSILGVFYLYGNLAKNERAIETAYLGIKTFFVTAGITYVAKELIHRERPYVTNNNLIWHGPFANIKNGALPLGDGTILSFPSGHSMSAFAMATVIANQYNHYKIVPIVAYSIASLTAMSRVYEDFHWSSDILVGSVLGYTMAKLICKKQNWNLNISPYSRDDSNGLSLRYTFK